MIRLAIAGAVTLLGGVFVGLKSRKVEITGYDSTAVPTATPVITDSPVELKTVPMVKPEPETPVGPVGVKHVVPLLRAVVAQKEPEPTKGVKVEVISDDHIPADLLANTAEVILHQESIDKRLADENELPEFWQAAFYRLDRVLTMEDDKAFLACHTTLTKGYYRVTLAGSNEVGIAHSTRSGLNALFPVGTAGDFRVVTNNQRFNGATIVGLKKAQEFLKGRY